MTRTRRPARVALAVAAAALLSGCFIPPNYPQAHYAPPPHAPAHGYRRQHQGREIRYDANLGVYAVVGFPHLYYLNDVYYKYDADHWYYSGSPRSHWHYCSDNKVPPGLAKKYKHKHKKKRYKNKD